MLAHIIPLRRLPRDVETFDYSVPDELKDTIRPGQLVTIPFRKSDILGLVLTIHNTTTMSSPTTIGNDIGGDLALKPIKTIINESPLLSEAHIQMLLKLSRWYGVSLATMVKWSLPPLKKRKLASLQVGKPKPKITDHISLITYH